MGVREQGQGAVGVGSRDGEQWEQDSRGGEQWEQGSRGREQWEQGS